MDAPVRQGLGREGKGIRMLCSATSFPRLSFPRPPVLSSPGGRIQWGEPPQRCPPWPLEGSRGTIGRSPWFAFGSFRRITKGTRARRRETSSVQIPVLPMALPLPLYAGCLRRPYFFLPAKKKYGKEKPLKGTYSEAVPLRIPPRRPRRGPAGPLHWIHPQRDGGRRTKDGGRRTEAVLPPDPG